MVNKRYKPTPLLARINRLARKADLVIAELPGRGRGSHRMFVIRRGEEVVADFTLTGHGDRELSWTVLRQTERKLTHLFGERWMED